MPPRTPRDPAWIRIADRIYTAAFVLLPKPFRSEYGDCMRQAFRDRCREVARGERSAFRALALELAPDLITTMGREGMQTGFGDMAPRQFALMGCLCLAFAGLAFRDAITPPVLDTAVAIRNRFNDFVDLRRIEAREANTRRVAEHLAGNSDAGSKALAALLYRSIAERKQNPLYFPDNQSESLYHRLPEKADAENARIRQLVSDALRAPDAGAYALVRAAESCVPEDGCDRAKVISRLEEVDSGNAYAWTLAFAEADTRNDEPARRNALSQLGRAHRYDTYEGETASRMIRAADAMGLDDDAATATLARDTTRAGLLYDQQFLLINDCVKQSRADGSSVVATNAMNQPFAADCHRAFELMAQSSSLGLSTFGWHLLVRSDDDPALRAEARDQLRDRYWLAGTRFEQGRVFWNGAEDFGSPRERQAWLAAFRGGDGEVASLRRWFIARGLPAHAPSDYHVPDENLAPRAR